MKHAILVVAALGLTACDLNKSGAEEAVRASLTDPESARFGAFYFNPDTQKGCVTVNAKNKMGGYVGDHQAYVEKTDEGWESQGIAEITVESCREAHADRKD